MEQVTDPKVLARLMAATTELDSRTRRQPVEPTGVISQDDIGASVPMPPEPSAPSTWQIPPDVQRKRDAGAKAIVDAEKLTPVTDPSVIERLNKLTGKAPVPVPEQPAPVPAAPKSVLEKTVKTIANAAYGTPEMLLSMGTGAFGQAYGGLKGLGTFITGGGLDEAVKQIENAEQKYTFQPRTPAGKAMVGAAGDVMEGANSQLGNVGESLGGDAGRTIGENVLPTALTLAPVPKIVKTLREAPKPKPGFVSDTGKVFSGKDVGAARDLAPKLEALEVAQKHDVAVDPSVTNPTRLNRMAVSHAGISDVADKLSITNENKWNRIVASDPDLNIRAPLSLEVIRKVRERAAEPNKEIANTGLVLPSEGDLATIESFRMKAGISNTDSANAVNSVVSRAQDLLKNGRDASEILKDISQLREDARRTFNKSGASNAEVAEARVSKKVAEVLEGMLDTHLYSLAERNPYGGFFELGEAYKNGRRTMAKTYAVEDAFNENTRQVDPAKLARMTAEDNALTGHLADVGKIAGVFPEIARLGVRTEPVSNVHLSKYRIPGVLGGMTGGVIGMAGGPVAGATGFGVGSLAGATVGEILSHVLRNKIVTPSVQARAVNPVPKSMWDLSGVDPLGNRPPPNPMGYDFGPEARPPSGTPQLTDAQLNALRRLKEQ